MKEKEARAKFRQVNKTYAYFFKYIFALVHLG